jgi:hypothetical protein
VRLRSTRGINADGSDASERGYEYFNASASGGVQPLDASSFYAHLFAESSFWDAAMAPAARVHLPGAEGARQVDGMWGGLVAALSLYVGNESNYGDVSIHARERAQALRRAHCTALALPRPHPAPPLACRAVPTGRLAGA